MRFPVLQHPSLQSLARLIAGATAALLGACGEPGAAGDGGPDVVPADEHVYELRLRPVRDGGDEVTAIEAEASINASLADEAATFSLSAPVVYAGVTGIADRVEQLEARDGNGPIALMHEDDPPAPGGFPYFRHWLAEREVLFPVTVTWRSAVEPHTDRRGPPFGIRAAAGGVSGAGSGFLVLPENVTSRASRVTWDLTRLAAGSAAVTSFGEGAFELDGPPADLMQGWYMAGPLERWPDAGDAAGFSAAWLGDFPFEERTEMEWAGRAYAFLGDFFAYLDPPPRYRVFMRMVESPPHPAGTALVNSFMLSRGPATEEENGETGPRGTFLHEMIHQWVGGIEGPHGVTSWFSEGLTSYYTLLAPLLAGYDTLAEYGEGANELVKAYYTNPAREWSAERIAEVGFGDEKARRVPYQRGALYFADLDSGIRGASGGARNLHAFMIELFAKREQEDFRFDRDQWVRLVTAELGPEAAAEFEDIVIDGALIVPASDAFGPCFERRPRVYATDDGTEVDGYEWVRVESVPDTECRDLS